MAQAHKDHTHIAGHFLLYRLFVLLKEYEARDRLLKWYTGLSDGDKLTIWQVTSPSPTRAEIAFKLVFEGLKNVAIFMSTQDRQWANLHLNRAISHHSGSRCSLEQRCHTFYSSPPLRPRTRCTDCTTSIAPRRLCRLNSTMGVHAG